MNLFLKGVPGAGKSTIIHRLLRDRNIHPSGFITLSGKKGGGNERNVYIHPAASPELQETRENLIGERFGEGLFRAHPETFNQYGVALLKKCRLPLILMDEIGFMERDANEFQQMILELLDGSIPILGVVKAKENPFTSLVENHPKSRILRVDESNREEALHRALQFDFFTL